MSLDFCSALSGNSGGVNCDNKRRTPRRFSVGSKVFTPSDYADEPTFAAAFKNAHLQNNGTTGKLFAFPKISQVVPVTEADTMGKLPLGPNRRLRKGNPGYTFNCEVNQTEFQNLVEAFDNQELPVFMLDSVRQMWFTFEDATGNVSGELALITVGGNGFEDGENIATGVCQIGVYYLDVDVFEQNSKYYKFTSLGVNDFKGLKTVELREPAAHVSNVHTLVPEIKTARLGGDLNIMPEHGTALAAATWTAFSGAPNFTTSLTVTGVAVTGTGNNAKLAFTFDSTTYTGLANNTQIRIVPPTVATLNTAGVTGIEILPKVVTKTP